MAARRPLPLSPSRKGRGNVAATPSPLPLREGLGEGSIGASLPPCDAPIPDYTEEAETGPLRRCIASGVRQRRETMLRFVAAPDGRLVFDAAARLPGRGLWVAAAAAALARAIAKRCFDRAARRSLVVPGDLASSVEAQVAARCIDTLGLARRAGTAIAGYEKVATALKRQAPGALLLASDAGEWARQKLGSARGEVIETLSSGELGQAFGRDKIVHVHVGPGALAEKLKIEAARLEGLRGNGVAPVVPSRDAI